MKTEAPRGVTRRLFLKSTLATGLAAAVPLGACATLMRSGRDAPASDSASPIQRIDGDLHPNGFTGDHPKHAHSILWDKRAYLAEKGGVPKPAETAEVVIVGGGLSGLMTAYELRDLKPVVLEQNAVFGGNAKGEHWGNLTYSIGSAYIPKPEAGSSLSALLDELGLTSQLRYESALEEGILVAGDQGSRFASPFWTGAADPAHAADISRIYKALVAISENSYPAIPAPGAAERERLNALDRQSFTEWVRANLAPLPPRVEELFHEYCWDSLGGTPDELSAAQALNFLTADLAGGSCALPGGNAAIADALYSKLKAALPEDRLRPRSLTVDISTDKDGVCVAYEDHEGKLHSIRARACVVTVPKFVAKALIDALPPEQKSAIEKLRYRAYLVANVLINGKMPSEHFGAFRLKDQVPSGDASDDDRAFTSMIFGSWASHDQADNASLTLYRAFPFDGGRGSLSPHAAYAKMRSRFEAVIQSTLGAFGVDSSRVAGLRITRWGHALPLAARGLIADGTVELASRQVDGRVLFAQQDNWASPCVESALTAALSAADAVRKLPV